MIENTLPDPLPTGGHWKIELGCGKRKAMDDLIGVDKHPFEPADIVADLEETPWAWVDDASCALVVTHQTLEHIDNLLPVMAEIWRICEAGAYVETVVPYGLGKPAIQDPTHRRFFTEETFRYWEPGYVEAFGDYGIEVFFAICGQRWKTDGNLWTLLYPLKTPADSAQWEKLRAESFKAGRGGFVAWPVQFGDDEINLLERADKLVGPAISTISLHGARYPSEPIFARP
jgi:SAM-dependent methyltransferase